MFSQRTNWNLDRNVLSKALAEHHAAGKPLIDLTQSNPTECGFQFDSREILAAFDNSANLTYKPDPQGLPQARQAVVDYYLSRNCKIDSADIFLTASTSEAYSFVFRALCNPGDEILIPQPGYPLFNFLADIQDVALTRYPLLYDHGWQIDMHAVEQAITPRTRAVIVVHPNNPTGHFCKPEEIEVLNTLCANRHLAIISDEVFLDFNLRQQTPPTFASNSEALTFTLSGISKISGLPQMKVAWLIRHRPGSAQAPSYRAPGNDCRHFSVRQHARAACPAGLPPAAPKFPSAMADSARKTTSRNSTRFCDTGIVHAIGNGRRLVRRA